MDCPVECFLIGLRRLRRPSYLPHILQSRIMHLSLTRRRLKVVQRANVSTHPPILPDADDRTLRQAQGAYSRALLESTALSLSKSAVVCVGQNRGMCRNIR